MASEVLLRLRAGEAKVRVPQGYGEWMSDK